MKSLKAKHFKKKKECRVTVLINNLMDKEVQRLLWPLNLMHHILLCPKYRIKNNFIDPNGLVIKFISLCFIISILSCFLYRLYDMSFNAFAKGRTNAMLKLPVHDFLCGLACLVFDFNLVYAMRLISLLRNKVLLWNCKVKDLLKKVDHTNNDSFCEKMFDTYVNIMDCYDIYIVTYQHLIVFHTVEFFFHFLLKLKVVTEIFKRVHVIDDLAIAWLTASTLYTWVVKSLIFEVILSSYCERFYMAMIDVQSTCAHILTSNLTDAEKRLCKNVRRLHRVKFTKMNACGMFYVDSTFPPTMLELITNYTVILFCYIKTYIHTLFGILFRIQAGKVYDEGILKYLLTSFVSLIWLYKDVTLFILLSVECEKLYSMMKEVQNICIQLAETRQCSDIQQNTCKNIVRHQIVNFKKMELCGLFAVDAALMLNFASIITSNIIVAFQFEFL
ncbi:hypothetical protein SFRURICE_016981 [Spodoptera frugiperda]|nr:hypothetical protein SFRURICE_016981 [Spodoptera frugiperda]